MISRLLILIKELLIVSGIERITLFEDVASGRFPACQRMAPTHALMNSTNCI